MHLKVPPPVVFAVSAVFLLAANWFLPQVSISFPGQQAFALLFVFVGLLTGVQALLGFLHNKTTVDPRTPKSTTTLVTHGVYRFTRNPMYLGLLCLLLAVSLYSGTLVGVMIVPAFVWYMNEFQIKPEEKALEAIFDETYESYRRRVRRWI